MTVLYSYSSAIIYNSHEAKHSFERIMEIVYGAKKGVHAFDYNSDESEPIWMKSGALWAYCWGLGLAYFGHDPSSSESLKSSQTFLVT